MFYIYILKSVKNEHYYTGQTKNLENRLALHNSGQVKSTKRYRPWRLVYQEKYLNRNTAVKREKYLKSHTGRKWLKTKFMGL